MKVFTQCLHSDLMPNIYLVFDSRLWKTLNSSNWENLQGFLKWVFAKAKKGIDFPAQPCLLMWHTFLNRHLFTVQTTVFCEDVLTVWMYSMLSSAQFSSDRSNNQSYLTCKMPDCGVGQVLCCSYLFKKGFGNVYVGAFYFTGNHTSTFWHGQSHIQCIVPSVHPCIIIWRRITLDLDLQHNMDNR